MSSFSKESYSNSHSFIKKSDVGDFVVEADPIALQQRLDICKFSISIKVSYLRGDKPWNTIDLKEKLAARWNLSEVWRLIPIGKGFFHAIMTSREEYAKVWEIGNLLLHPGIVRVSSWEPNFNPFLQKHNLAQIWIRLHGLNWVFWHPKILNDLATCIGSPLILDRRALEGDLGIYPRVLVEVNMEENLPDQISFHALGQKFAIKIEYEWIPPFCNECRIVGHSIVNCRKVREKVFSSMDKPKTGKPSQSFKLSKDPQKSDTPDKVEISHKGHADLSHPPTIPPSGLINLEASYSLGAGNDKNPFQATTNVNKENSSSPNPSTLDKLDSVDGGLQQKDISDDDRLVNDDEDGDSRDFPTISKRGKGSSRKGKRGRPARKK